MATVLVLSPVFGVMPVTVGAGPVMLKPPARVPACRSVFVATTSQTPRAAPVRLNAQVICVGLTMVTLVPGMSVCPVFFSETVTPGRNPVPARLVMLTLPVLAAVAGVMLVTVGAGAVTVKPPEKVAV